MNQRDPTAENSVAGRRRMVSDQPAERYEGEKRTRLPPAEEARFALFVSLIQHGESVGAASRRSGLSADQVLYWLEDDPSVAAELKATRKMIETQIQFRLVALAHKAVEAIDQALDQGDGRVAVDVLTGLGLLGRNNMTSGDKETVE